METAVVVEALEIFLIEIEVSSGSGCNFRARDARCLVEGTLGADPLIGVKGGPRSAPEEATGDIIFYYCVICDGRLPGTISDPASIELIGDVLPGPFSMIFF